MKKIIAIAVAVLVLSTLSVSVFAAEDDNLALSATVNAPYCSTWENPAALNDGVIPSASDEATAAGEGVARYGSWGGAYSNYETVAYEWAEAVTVDSIGVFFGYNVTHDDWVISGGLQIPTSYTVQYWNGSEYVDVTNGNGYGVAADVLNVTTFDAVTTTSVQITFCKLTDAELSSDAMIAEIANIQAWYDTEYPEEGLVATADDALGYRGIGLYEIEVYEASAEGGENNEESNEENTETGAPQTGVATVVLAVAAMLSGAYIVSKKH